MKTVASLSPYIMPGMYRERQPDNELAVAVKIAVCKHFYVDYDDLGSESRKREKTIARQVAIYFIFHCSKLSLKEIARHFGGRHHSTVIHAIKTVNDLNKVDKEIRQSIYTLTTELARQEIVKQPRS